MLSVERIGAKLGEGMEPMEQHTAHFKNVNNCLNINIYSYSQTSGGQCSILYLNVVHFFSTQVLIRHMWQVKTVVFLHWCQIHAVLLTFGKMMFGQMT
jgi:hypothetical protein